MENFRENRVASHWDKSDDIAREIPKISFNALAKRVSFNKNVGYLGFLLYMEREKSTIQFIYSIIHSDCVLCVCVVNYFCFYFYSDCVANVVDVAFAWKTHIDRNKNSMRREKGGFFLT